MVKKLEKKNLKNAVIKLNCLIKIILNKIHLNINILYHESTFLEKHVHLAKKTKHSTALQASKIAKAANVNKLILGHFSARYKDLNEFKIEAQSNFKNTFLAQEGELFTF